ncbi:hypothetical protein JHK82_039765 [Glycine max]|nr:hypothetical protein JHK87_039756 [Glycine soja]KAG4963088.1 hypothetical protein JHK86_039956 [Glycine max]KAG4965561.1 hypothetical protein JHK85_040536 [Glycine max]KAG5110542.1 hypothetical protein JHK82_039765 [Glycine max]KAG5121829.1 hypothetical protein JHK84_040169 [Glycine max]
MDLIKKGASVFFFPEGTHSKDGRLGTFKVIKSMYLFEEKLEGWKLKLMLAGKKR